MARPKLTRITLKSYDPRIELTKEGKKNLNEELKKRNLSIRGMAREVGITENVALHLCSEGKAYLSVLNKVIEKLDLKVIVEVEK